MLDVGIWSFPIRIGPPVLVLRLSSFAVFALKSVFVLSAFSAVAVPVPIFLCAAHNAARVASESLVMNEMRVHVVITEVSKSDQRHESSVVNVPSRAGQARFRAAALSERCSFVNGATRSLVCGLKWLPNLYRMGEGQARRLDSSSAR